jgi:hypothetical protein
MDDVTYFSSEHRQRIRSRSRESVPTKSCSTSTWAFLIGLRCLENARAKQSDASESTKGERACRLVRS